MQKGMLHSISQVFIFKYVSFVKTAFYVRVNNIVISSIVVYLFCCLIGSRGIVEMKLAVSLERHFIFICVRDVV